MIKITLTDGTIKEYSQRVLASDVTKDISMGLYRNALAVEINGKVCDLMTEITQDATFKVLTFDDKDGKKAFWHTASHLMALAVKNLYPAVKIAIGPAIDNGFYYDFDIDTQWTPEELEKIEKEMKRLAKENLKIERFTLSRAEALEFMKDEPYKVELINDLPADAVLSFYKLGDFTDLCAGPHMESVSPIKAVKLMSVAGAYWRGSEKNKMLKRIYATAYPKASMLDEYLTRLEEAKKRDHRRIGKEMDLFTILEEGPGFPFFMPKGMILRNLLEDFWRTEHKKNGYQEIKTPIILNQDLWHRSGHWDHYKDNMYTVKIDDGDYAIKPMNCPGGMLAYKRKIHSYKDLPQRMAELGLVHRHELSGALHGLMRVRCFTQDDAHIFMTPEQIAQEVLAVYDMIDKFYGVFGFKYNVELSTRPENSMGSDEQWNMATEALRTALESKNKPYIVNEGDGAFYGPKIDFHLEDSIGRTWQCGTIQLDFQMPERFDLSYVGQDNEKHRPVMIHRVVFGSIERFIAILTEHFAGAFPLWLAPVQVRLLPIADRHLDYCKEVEQMLESEGIRTEIDDRSEKTGFKIREAQLSKVPYMLVIGDSEVEQGKVSARSREKTENDVMSASEFVAMVVKKVKDKE